MVFIRRHYVCNDEKKLCWLFLYLADMFCSNFDKFLGLGHCTKSVLHEDDFLHFNAKNFVTCFLLNERMKE